MHRSLQATPGVKTRLRTLILSHPRFGKTGSEKGCHLAKVTQQPHGTITVLFSMPHLACTDGASRGRRGQLAEVGPRGCSELAQSRGFSPSQDPRVWQEGWRGAEGYCGGVGVWGKHRVLGWEAKETPLLCIYHLLATQRVKVYQPILQTRKQRTKEGKGFA